MFQASCPALLHYTMLLCQSLSSFPPPACVLIWCYTSIMPSPFPFSDFYCLLGIPYLPCPSVRAYQAGSMQEVFTNNTCTHNKLYLPLVEHLQCFIKLKTYFPTHTHFSLKTGYILQLMACQSH